MPRGLQTVRRILVLIHKYSTSDELYGMSVLGGGGKLRVWLFIGAAAVSEVMCVCHFTVNWFRSGTVSLHRADT